MQYKIILKPPFGNSVIWAGPNVSGHIPTAEDSKMKTRREALATRLENLTGEKPSWRPREYTYYAELTAEQASDVASWPGVRRVEQV